MHKTFRDVTWLSLSAKWSTNVVENSSVNCEGMRDEEIIDWNLLKVLEVERTSHGHAIYREK